MALMLRHFAVPMYLKISQYVLAGLQPVLVAALDCWRGTRAGLRALEQRYKETRNVEREGVEDHDVTEPLVQF
jgi:hypothetical protein